MKRTALALLTILTATLTGRAEQALGPVASHTPAVSGWVARVNGVSLTDQDLARMMRQIFPYYSIHGGRVPAEKEPEIRQQALDRIVLEELLYQEAKRRGVQAPESKVRARIAEVRKAYASEQEFRQARVAMSGSESAFRQKIRRAVMAEELWEGEVVRPSRLTPAQVREFYRQNPKRFTQPESVWLQTISLEVPKGASSIERELIRKKAEEVLTMAKKAQTLNEFGALAEKYSTDDWRVMNGDHRWVHRGTVDPELEAAFRLAPGQTSDLVRSSYGFHILRVNGRRPQRLVPFQEVKDSLTRSLSKERLEQRRKEFEARLRAAARIEFP